MPISNLDLFLDIAEHHFDAEASLRLYFSATNPNYQNIFAIYFPSEVATKLRERVDETDTRSALVLLTYIEAAFRRDYSERCRLKMSDSISIEFRKINRKKRKRVGFEEDILDVWYQYIDPADRKIISALRGMIKFRHWLEHGRYWNIGNKYKFQDVYVIADAIFNGFALRG